MANSEVYSSVVKPDTLCSRKWEKVQFSCIWIIEDFHASWEVMGEEIKSSNFSHNNETEWSLILKPKSDSNEHYVSLFLSLDSSKKTKVSANFEFSLIGYASDEQVITYTKTHSTKYFTPGQTNIWGFEEFIRRDWLLCDALLHEGKITILCVVTVLENATNVVIDKKRSSPFNIYWGRFCTDFTDLFHSSKLSDITLKARNNAEFKAHKAVLAARSTVFTIILELKNITRLEIDAEQEALKETLHYIYNGSYTKAIKKLARELIAVADKYALVGLKTMCEDALWHQLTAENSADTFLLAHQHNATQLKAETVKFMEQQRNEVLATAGFRNASESHPNLIMEMLGVAKAQKNRIQSLVDILSEKKSCASIDIS